jgi:FkbM family methyltransferase
VRSARSLLRDLVRLPLRLVPPGTPLPVLSGPLRGARWISTSSTHGCWLGLYERGLQRALCARLRPGDVVLDVGANAGFFTLLAARRVGAGGAVYALEPAPGNLARLRAHLALNGVRNAEVIEAAAWETDGELAFAETEDPTAGRVSPGGGRRVRTVSIDSLLRAGRIREPDALKIDVEGAECEVLRGAAALLESRRPALFLSTHGWRRHQWCWERLAALGYDLRLRRDGTRDGTYEVVALSRS